MDSIYNLSGARMNEARMLSDLDFEGENFERFLIGPGKLPASLVTMENCHFKNCFVRGEFWVAHGVTLKDVVFENIRSPDLLTISTQARLNQVVVRGAGAGLWVKPSEFTSSLEKREYENWADSELQSTNWVLDFSEYEGKEVEVLGLPLEKIRWNPVRNVALRLRDFDSEVWKSLNFPVNSFWRLCVKRLEVFGVTEGVYSLPSVDDKKFHRTMEERDRLIQMGVLT